MDLPVANACLANFSVTHLRGVGPNVAQKLSKLGITTLEDLLLHLPSRYQNRTSITKIADLKTGAEQLLEGIVTDSNLSKGKKPRLTINLTDDSASINIIFFYFGQRTKQLLPIGTKLRCFGEIRSDYHGLTLTHPEYQIITEQQPVPLDTCLTPVYPLTDGLGQKQLRKLISKALQFLTQSYTIKERLPEALLTANNWPTISKALQTLHQLPANEDLSLLQAGKHPCQRRLAFEELLAHNLLLQQRRDKMQVKPAPTLVDKQTLTTSFKQQLPFTLTTAQEKVVAEINQDLAKTYPMQRLLQGDVGCGKTVVAALSLLRALENNYQAALMAPTELLAEQHYHTLSQWLQPMGVSLRLLSGATAKASKDLIKDGLAAGNIQLVIGTHALIQEDISFAKLGLVVIDEQHRFGVKQRHSLLAKAAKQDYYPHQLVMTATPIPRTLAMCAYADLDCSVIDELPKGRVPVVTAVMPASQTDKLISRITALCQAGRQAYWVCTQIEESEQFPSTAASQTARRLQQLLPELTIGLVHGRLKSAEKEAIMAQFSNGQINLLVATTVIEVGVDVPNASVMIIENAERLGLAQIHQLRGRVGRGATDSYCILLYSGQLSQQAHARLQLLRECSDGFSIAQRDLELRGPGELPGTKQAGMLRLKIADIIRDGDLMPTVQQAAAHIKNKQPAAIPNLITRWIKTN